MNSKLLLTIVLSCCFGNICLADKTNIEKLGDILQVAIPLSGAGYSLIIKDYEGTWQLAKGSASTLALTQMLKYTIDEKRPNYKPGDRKDSFPSGHTSAAFAGASFIQKRYGWEAGVPAYMLSAFVGYSRVHAKKHSWFDVLAGAAIGTGFGYYFTDGYIEKDKVNVTLSADPKEIYIGASFLF